MTIYGHSPTQVLKLERVNILISAVLIVGSSIFFNFSLLEHPFVFVGVNSVFALLMTLDLKRKIKKAEQ